MDSSNFIPWQVLLKWIADVCCGAIQRGLTSAATADGVAADVSRRA